MNVRKNSQRETLADRPPETLMQGAGFAPKKVWEDALQYVLRTLWSAKVTHRKARPEDVAEVRRRLESYLVMSRYIDDADRMASQAALDEAWPEFEALMTPNPGMVKLMLDHGWRSEIIGRYILQGAQASSLEVFFGRAYDWQMRFRDIPLDDQAVYYAVWEPIGVFIRERVKFAQRYLDQPGLEVMTVGAGFCPEWRRNGFLERRQELQHKVIAVEKDPRVFEQMQDVYEIPPAELGIEYLRADLRDICKLEEYRNRFPVVLAQGLGSYQGDLEGLKSFLSDLLRVTKPGGTVIFDLQVMEPTLIRCAACMGWRGSGLKPEKSVKKAVKKVKLAAQHLAVQLTECRVDRVNVRPVGVMCAIKKGDWV